MTKQIRTLIIGLFLVLISPRVSGQADSTILTISYPADRELKMSNSLNGIQMLTLKCEDTSMLGRQFRLYVDEYKYGKRIDTDSFGISCNDRKFPIVIGEDTSYYYYNLCSKMSYTEDCTNDEFYIMFGGKLDQDSFRMKINYPALHLDKTIAGADAWRLKTIDCRYDTDFWFQVGERTPLLAYTPPFDAGNGISSYCLLKIKPPAEWYKAYGVEHFYIFELKIM